MWHVACGMWHVAVQERLTFLALLSDVYMPLLT